MLAIRALDGTQGLLAAGSSAHAGPLICDPDPPYLSNPEYGFHLNSGRSPTSTNAIRNVQTRRIHPRQDLRGAHLRMNTFAKRREKGTMAGGQEGEEEEHGGVHAARIARKKAPRLFLTSRKGIFYRIRNSTVRVQPIIWFIPGELRCTVEKRSSAWHVLSGRNLCLPPPAAASTIGLLFVPFFLPFSPPSILSP